MKPTSDGTPETKAGKYACCFSGRARRAQVVDCSNLCRRCKTSLGCELANTTQEIGVSPDVCCGLALQRPTRDVASPQFTYCATNAVPGTPSPAVFVQPPLASSRLNTCICSQHAGNFSVSASGQTYATIPTTVKVIPIRPPSLNVC